MKACFVYTSLTGNTKAIIDMINQEMISSGIETKIYKVKDLPYESLTLYDYLIIGTYTFGNGVLPKEMRPLYDYFSHVDMPSLKSAIVGTGDRFYPYFCGAVDQLVEPLNQHTDLRVTMKVELYPEEKDKAKIPRLIQSLTK